MAKEAISANFVHAFLEARDKVRKTGEKTPIKGFSGWHVSPIKKEDLDHEDV